MVCAATGLADTFPGQGLGEGRILSFRCWSRC